MSVPYESEKPGNPGQPTSRSGPTPPAAGPEAFPPAGRVHISARQRGADVTTVGALALHMPQVLTSLAVVFLTAYVVEALTGLPWWGPLGLWVLSGAAAFHRPSERLMARRLFGLRHPTPEESRKLRAVWREVTARAGVDGTAYQLWVEDSDDVNAMAAAGHIVGVTSHSVRGLPHDQLAAVLAHELGHHTRGHAWASLFAFWYALPARLTWRLLRLLASRVGRLPAGTAAVVIGLAGVGLVAVATATYGLVFLPLVTPYLVAAISRRSELRADEHAAALGFAPQLITVLSAEHDHERAVAAGLGDPSARDGLIAQLLDSHPDLTTRLHHLQSRLETRRGPSADRPGP